MKKIIDNQFLILNWVMFFPMQLLSNCSKKWRVISLFLNLFWIPTWLITGVPMMLFLIFILTYELIETI